MKQLMIDVELKEIDISKTNILFREAWEMTDEELAEFAADIEKNGVIQPILIRPLKVKDAKKKYELVAGERRFRGSLIVWKKDQLRSTIPAVVRELSDQEALDLQVIENYKRKDPNPMMQAHAFAKIIAQEKISAAAFAGRIGVSPDFIEERVMLTKIHKDAQEYVRKRILPLKAALKLSRIPQNLQRQALDKCITTINGAAGTTETFNGLAALSQWMNFSLNDLSQADFDKEDPKLVPSAGACTTCPFRTTNSNGLFNDISRGDRCMNAACFKGKQLANYAALTAELKTKNPDYDIVYKSREYWVDDHLKKLAPRVESHHGTPVSKSVADNEETAKICIYIGKGDSKKKFEYLSFKKEKPVSGRSPAPGRSSAAELVKQKDVAEKAGRTSMLQDFMITEMIAKKVTTIPASILAKAITNELDDLNYYEELAVIGSMGINWKITVDGKKVDCTKDTDYASFVGKDIDMDRGASLLKLIEGLPMAKLHAMYVMCLYFAGGWGIDDMVKKSLKIDDRAIATKAKALTDKWWKEEQLRRKTIATAASKKPLVKAKK